MSILQALASHYGRLVAEGEAPQFGYSRERISYAIVLSADGEAIDVQLRADTSGRTPRPSLLVVPRPVPRTSGVAANYLWDKTAYVLGMRRDQATDQAVPAKRGEHEAFKEFHDDLLAGAEDIALVALRTFLATWCPERYHGLRYADDMLDTNVVFRLDGELRLLHERPAAQAIWNDHLAGQEQAATICLVTGAKAPIARLHAKIKGVAGAQSSGASVVSFNLPAFASYGMQQGANAPVSERAAFAYSSALNVLLSPDSRRRIRIADATTVFWAEASGSETAGKAAEALFSLWLDPPTDEEEAAKVRDKIDCVARGRPLREIDPDVHPDTRFSVLGLAPNASRLSVRFWHQDSIDTFARRIREHWNDLRLEPTPWRTAPSVRRLLYETAVQRKAENIPPALGGAVMRAILTGAGYPQSLLAAVIMRVRADGAVAGLRVAIVKACIVRAERLSNPKTYREDHLVSLDRNSDSIAYNLGRLFAAYAYAERSVAERNATIRDKYMGAASATPRRVFPILMRGYEHNRASLSKGGRVGAGVRADQAVSQIVARIPGSGELPTALQLEDQARFFVGYYHQEQAFYTSSKPDQNQLADPNRLSED